MLNDNRPDPDRLLAKVQRDDTRSRRGKLRIFFGYAAGVGKTFAMLTAAQRERAAGVDVVVGYVEPHGRPETERLLEGLPALPPYLVPYRDVQLREFDLDAALARRPQLMLVDELAHTNAEGLRHTKRWQDVVELLDAGIDVWSTLNVQHIESLNDVIAQITGVVVRETLPDAVLEQADEIELIDVTPTELVDRLEAGKVYLPAQAQRALKNFFQRGNLVALRELSLRQAANRLQRDVDAARHERAASSPWLTTERLLVCVGPSPSSARILRTAKRLAASLGCEWLAVAVNTGDDVGDAAWMRTGQNLRLAGQLGAETHTLTGRNVAETVIQFAHERNVSKIVLGKTAQVWWKRRLFGVINDQLLKKSGDIDVYIVSGEGASTTAPRLPVLRGSAPWQEYFIAGAIVAFSSALGFGAEAMGLAESNIGMIFLAGVALVAMRLGRGPAIAAVVSSVLVFDFCFVPPQFTFAVGDSEYLIMFAVMLGIGLLISGLASRQRSQLEASQQQERRTAQLFRMTRQLSELAGVEFLVGAAGRQLSDIFGGETVLYLREPEGSVTLRYGAGTSISQESVNHDVAQWVAGNSKIAGLGTDTLPNATAMFVPLTGSQRTVGAIGVRPSDLNRFLDPEQLRFLEACASLIALAIERDASLLDAQQATLAVETEQLRNALLSSVSHDLRTPLASIAGSASGLSESFDTLDPVTRRELLDTITDESGRLARIVENLLHMTRLSSGRVAIDRQWQPVEDVIGSALNRMERQLAGREVLVALADGLPLGLFDEVLVEIVLVNLLENAVKYSPPESPLEIRVANAPGAIAIEVRDFGRGFIPGDEHQVFAQFYRGADAKPDRRGTGLGLAICKAIVQAHDGVIVARTRPEGGASIRFTLPYDGEPPPVEADGEPRSGSAGVGHGSAPR